MRRWVMAAVFAAAAQGALAADLPEDFPALRGGITDGLSRNSVNWQGAYAGGQLGYSSANMNFSNATSSLTSFMLQNLGDQQIVSSWTLLGSASPSSIGFGGFAGYNAQWDDVIVGVEANYDHLSGLSGLSANQLPSIIIAGGAGCLQYGNKTNLQCGQQLSGSASATVNDTLTLRARAGYAFDNFLPYMFGGLALGRVSIARSVALTENDTYRDNTTLVVSSVTWPTKTTVADDNNVFAYGYTAGAGVEAMLWRGLFARGEYEYIKFNTIKNINIQMSTIRAGLGYKF